MKKKELIKLCKSSASRSGSRNFLRILQHCEIGHFSHFGSYLLKKTDRIFREVPLNFGSHLDRQAGSAS